MNIPPFGLSRRRFIEGIALGSLAASLPSKLLAAPVNSGQISLRGNHFNLDVGTHSVDFTGRSRPAVAVNNVLPAPILRWREGERVTLDVRNQLSQLTAIHWHGIVLPFDMDGVPGISFNGIHPGQTFRYQFDMKQNGTYWYHGHAGFQEQLGLYGAIVIEPRDGDPHRCDRDYVVLLCQRRCRHLARPTDVEPDADERSRSLRRHRHDLHLPDERQHAGTKLARTIQTGRTGSTAFHQRIGDDAVRRAYSRSADAGDRQ